MKLSAYMNKPQMTAWNDTVRGEKLIEVVQPVKSSEVRFYITSTKNRQQSHFGTETKVFGLWKWVEARLIPNTEKMTIPDWTNVGYFSTQADLHRWIKAYIVPKLTKDSKKVEN